MNCRVCNAECKLFLDLGKQPIANNFLTKEQFKDEVFYNLKVYFCPECFTVQVGECPGGADVFNKDYSFFTSTSEYMIKHFAELADLIKEKYMPTNGVIMEIGSNDGTFLEHFKDNVHLGFDPSESVNKIARAKGVRIYPYPFEGFGDGDGLATWPKINVFVSANAFAHIPDRNGVLANIKKMLAVDGVWIDEEPYLGFVLKDMAYDQFYNEHIFYTTISSMRNTLLGHDLDIIDYEFVDTHGGSIRYFVGHRKDEINEKINSAIKEEGLNNFDILKEFGKKVVSSAAIFKNKLDNLDSSAVGYAASAKSTTLLNYCNIGVERISKIYDTTPEKQGKFSPGMHIPIVPYERFLKDDPMDVILFIPNHSEEVFKKEFGVRRNWIMPR